MNNNKFGHNGIYNWENEFPKNELKIINSTVYRGYSIADEFYKEAPEFLKSKSALNIAPELKNKAVEFSFFKACELGLLPYKFDYVLNESNGQYYVKMINRNNDIITLNQTQSDKKPSRKANFRENLNASCQTTLDLFGDNIIKEIQNNDSGNYFEINHGYQSTKPKFVVIGAPSLNNKWISKLRLNTLVYSVSNEGKGKDIITKTKEISGFDLNGFDKFLKEQ